jgi:hypothetical protein
MMRDKRAFLRMKTDWGLEYRVFNNAYVEPAMIASRIIDVGGGGFCLESARPLGVGTLVQFALKAKDDPKPIIGVAKTVWSWAFNGSFKNGVNFVWASWKGVAAQRGIADYIEDHFNEKLT